MVVPPGPLVLVLLGLASLAAATALNRLALAHSATYRESPLPIVPAFRS
jgi:hypothetical protein